MPRQVRALAPKSALNARAREGAIIVIDAFDYDAPKTSHARRAARRASASPTRRCSILTDGVKPNVFLSGRNLPNVHVMPYADVSTYHILWSDVVLIEAGALGQTLEPIAETRAAPAREARGASRARRRREARPRRPRRRAAAQKTARRRPPKAAKKSAAKKARRRSRPRRSPRRRRGSKRCRHFIARSCGRSSPSELGAYQDRGEYTLRGAPDANKPEIRQAIEKLFGVKVTGVWTSNHARQGRARSGQSVGRRPHWKKAIVKLADGDTIEIFEG